MRQAATMPVLPANVRLTAAELVATSKDSYVRPLHPTGTAGDAPAAPGPG